MGALHTEQLMLRDLGAHGGHFNNLAALSGSALGQAGGLVRMAVGTAERAMELQVIDLFGGQQGAVGTRMAVLSPAPLAPRGPLGT